MDLKMKMGQKQLLTQQIIQTMNILQMNALELETYINELALENPAIEILETRNVEDGDTAQQVDAEKKLNWLESTDWQNRVYYRDDDELSSREAGWQDIKDKGESLTDYLKAQIVQKQYTHKERQLIDCIIDSLDTDGYFTDNVDAVADFLGVSPKETLRMLGEVQKLEPAGVGARNLTELLLIQLARIEDDPDLIADTAIVIQEYLPLLAKNHLHIIARKMKISPERIDKCSHLIRSLNPKPGNLFNDRSHVHYIRPDISVIKQKDHFDIVVNEYTYPAFRVNEYYEHLAKTTEDQETRDYLKDRIRQTRELSDSLSYRVSTLSRVAQILVEQQNEFFVCGPGFKRPMQLIDIAEKLNLHPSTISRALKNKHLQCSWGTYPLNYFLAAAVTTKNENETFTQDKIILKIEELIDAEDKKKPLSDQKNSRKAERIQHRNIP